MNRKGMDQDWMERWGGRGWIVMRKESVNKRKSRVTCLTSPLSDLNANTT